MKISIEILYHCRCDSCNLWWSIADREPPREIYCPDCGRLNKVDGFTNGKKEDVLGFEWCYEPIPVAETNTKS